MMPFTKQHSAYAWVVTCILFLINLTFHNLPLHSSYKIHQPITDYFLRLPYSELLEKTSFSLSGQPSSSFTPGNHERRESIPLSLFLVSQWERRILMKECTLQEQVLLGGFLCLLWGGLRFADGQRISLQSLSWCVTALRGSCYRTKTSRSGQPWAIQARGF